MNVPALDETPYKCTCMNFKGTSDFLTLPFLDWDAGDMQIVFHSDNSSEKSFAVISGEEGGELDLRTLRNYENYLTSRIGYLKKFLPNAEKV